MNTIETAYINALLADASYVTQIAKGDIAAERFKTRLTQTQADFLAANFKVIDSVETHNPNKPGDPPGFDAVVWEGKSGTPFAGQLYVSMRGTQGKTDISDDIDLVATGSPRNQIIAMANWWMRISTPIGQKMPRKFSTVSSKLMWTKSAKTFTKTNEFLFPHCCSKLARFVA